MSRAVLRLVEPLSDALDFPEGKCEPSGLREINAIHEVHSHLQLFLSWPDYSSSFIKVSGEIVKATISVDQGLNEFDQMFITTDESSFNCIKKHNTSLERIYIEVFGITFGFEPRIQECIADYTEGMPCLSLEIPLTLTRYNMRGTRRVQLDKPKSLLIEWGKEKHEASLIDVSPNAFCISIQNVITVLNDRVTIAIDGRKFDAYTSTSLNNSIILKPITNEPEHFGPYFEVYVEFAYPMLRSRYSFPEDPIPELMRRTGQSEKFAKNEQTNTWIEEINQAYTSSKEVKDIITSDFVAVDQNESPIGTSSLAKAFIDQSGSPIWAFHGLGITQSPEFLNQTCALYNWRSDYILSKSESSRIVGWFDGNGKWLDKVYTKFQRLTSDLTEISVIRNNRYIRNYSVKTEDTETELKPEKIETISFNHFKRVIGAYKNLRFGLGVPYLNYSGVLNNIFITDPKENEDIENIIKNVVKMTTPERFFIPTPVDMKDIEIIGFDMFCLKATTRQFITTNEALKYFSSSLEHSKAVVKRKHAI